MKIASAASYASKPKRVAFDRPSSPSPIESERAAFVFEAFRKEVLALDPCVGEEFLKLYVAYKAETIRRYDTTAA
jgi:hypothetical protein